MCTRMDEFEVLAGAVQALVVFTHILFTILKAPPKVLTDG